MLVHILWIFLASLSFGQTLVQWLEGDAKREFSKVAELARPILQDIERIAKKQRSVMLLPTDKAWEQNTADGKRGDVIFKTLLASPELSKEYMKHLAGEIPRPMQAWAEVYAFAKKNGGYIGSASGIPIRLHKDGKVCTTESVDGDYEDKDCTQADTGNPIPLYNEIVFGCDTIIIPEALMSAFP